MFSLPPLRRADAAIITLFLHYYGFRRLFTSLMDVLLPLRHFSPLLAPRQIAAEPLRHYAIHAALFRHDA